ncbi:hypothetical protein LCGC14_0224310 [marine sediment metagenome]|uniref:Uncharacterized protein n=1 Tax=marine sediment metagenome TaxID=412755 RepID=A0A0F9XG31_9ZZZZ
MKKPNKLPYYGTKVSIRDTIAKIKELLRKYNLIGIQITEYGEIFRLVFALENNGKKYAFQFEIITPDNPQFARQKFRAFYWHLKSRLEAVDFGLFTLQEVFMPELLVSLPDGTAQTIKNVLKYNQKLLPVNYFEV